MAVIFDQGDIVLVNLDPTIGHEPQKERPALVVSRDLFNRTTSMTIVCPITSRDNGFPLHRPLPAYCETRGWIITEQLRALDLDARGARLVEKLRPTDAHALLETVRSFF